MKANTTTTINAGLLFIECEKGLTIKVVDSKDFLESFEYELEYDKEQKEYVSKRYICISDFLDRCGLIGNGWHDITDTIALFSGEVIGYDMYTDNDNELTDENMKFGKIYAFIPHEVYNYLVELANKGEVFFSLVQQDTDTQTEPEKIGVKTWLPIFPGFYNTLFEADNDIEIHDINSRRKANNLAEIDCNDNIEFDYDTYKDKAAKDCCKFIASELKEFVYSIKFEAIRSPKYYNYSNDSINCTITPNIPTIEKFVNDNFEAFEKYIKDNYSSRDGFISSYTNDAKEFFDSEALTDTHKLGAILEFICEVKEITEISMYESVEAWLTVKDYDFQLVKVKCEACGNWYDSTESLKKYNGIIEREVSMYKELMGFEPTVKTFEEWVKLNPIECPNCDGE